MPGASPETMASAVATPLERQFAAIAGLTVDELDQRPRPTSITLQFDLNRDVDGAAREVQTAMNAARGRLPKTSPTPPPTTRSTRPTAPF